MTLVFVHGVGSSSLSFYYQTQFFKDSDALDLHGDPQSELCTSIDCYVERVRAHITDKGYQDVVLVGHSMGGAIALLYGLQYPDELKALVLISTGARLKVHPQYLKELEEAVQDRTQWLKDREARHTFLPSDLRKLFVEKAAEIGPAAQLHDYLVCDKFDTMDRVEEITLPTLVLCGSEDIMTPVKFSHYLANKIPGARSQIVDGASHFVPLEKPGEVNQAIAEFVQGLS
jgi:pimeloyl-ACP methyl ester carboxylesterase